MSNAVTVPADKLAKLQREAACWRWLVAQHNTINPIAQVIWMRDSRPNGQWVNLIDGHDLAAHVERASGVPEAPAPAAPPEHVCGLQGFGALGDECPACTYWRKQTDERIQRSRERAAGPAGDPR